jgi:hypothetical protein
MGDIINGALIFTIIGDTSSYPYEFFCLRDFIMSSISFCVEQFSFHHEWLMFACDEEMKLLAYVSYNNCFKDKLHKKKQIQKRMLM